MFSVLQFLDISSAWGNQRQELLLYCAVGWLVLEYGWCSEVKMSATRPHQTSNLTPLKQPAPKMARSPLPLRHFCDIRVVYQLLSNNLLSSQHTEWVSPKQLHVMLGLYDSPPVNEGPRFFLNLTWFFRGGGQGRILSNFWCGNFLVSSKCL